MKINCERCEWPVVEPLREAYRAEMLCQVLHDSLHRRPGWVEWYRLSVSDVLAGYGAVAVAGPWINVRALFEIYVLPRYKPMLLPLGEELIQASKADQMLVQTNDRTLAVLMEQFGHEPVADKIVFASGTKTNWPNPGAIFRRRIEGEQPAIFAHEWEPVGDWVLEVAGEIVATGGYLTHYNPPFVDLYMEVREDMRRRGLGSYLLQEIRRVAEENRLVVCARCNIDNVASMKTLARAGLVPCAHRITAKIK